MIGRVFVVFVVALALRCASAGGGTGATLSNGGPTVVLVPGMTGSRLCSKTTGELLWGDSVRLLRPWDGGRALARPLDGGENDVVPCGAIREMRVAQWSKDIYGGLIDFFTGNGVAFEVFDHDWRRDNVENARLLARKLQGKGRVNLICQSNGAYICRYLVKYGDVSLDEAERGMRRPPEGVTIGKVVLIGNANGGAIRILQELNRGRQYIRIIGRRWRPETLFTMPSLYQDLPVYEMDLFVDERRNAMTVDLFDPANWKKYGWSIYTRATTPEQDAFLASTLRNAARMHDLLHQDNAAPLPRYYSIQSSDFPTPAKAMLLRRNGRWRTRFDDSSLMVTGDRHATVESQQWLSGDERAAMAETIRVKGRHFEMITTDETRAHLLRIVSR